ncbi:MAG: hypothetical protein WCH11_00365 [Bdellovibrio sp.]
MFERIHKLNLQNSRGQAFVEYLLILVVSVSLISVIAYRLFTPLREWARNYMGAYVECLLDAGELPRIGGGSGEAGECDEGFEPFTVAEGRPSRGGSGNSLGLGGGSGMPPYTPSGRSLSSGRTNLSGDGSASGRGVDALKKSPGREEIAASNFYNGSTLNRGSSVSPAPVPRTQTLSEEELTEAERRRLPRRASKNTNMGSVEGLGPARKALVIPPRDRKPAQFDDEMEPFTFGRIFRIAFIVAILGVLILLVLLQARQIQKGMEKRNS